VEAKVAVDEDELLRDFSLGICQYSGLIVVMVSCDILFLTWGEFARPRSTSGLDSEGHVLALHDLNGLEGQVVSGH
jgi:hypothetical protein